jgi:ABC-type multidrug transport system ATPase subunit
MVARPDLVRHSIGIIFQDASLDDRLTGLENLRFHAACFTIPRFFFSTNRRSASIRRRAATSGSTS